MFSQLVRPLRGIITPTITPLLDRDQLDVESLERLVEHLLGGGVHGLFILGSTGEGPSLGYRLRRELIDRTCNLVGERLPVLVGITDTSLVEAIALTRHAAEAGAAAVVLGAPFYFAASQAEMLLFLERLVQESPLPAYLYNLPGHPACTFSVDTVRRAAELPGIHGLKDSSGNMIYFHKVRQALAHRPDFSLLMGPEEMLADGMLLGAHGGVCGGSNLFPELYVALYEQAVQRRHDEVARLHARILDVSTRIYQVGQHPGTNYLRGLKCAMALSGLCRDVFVEPLAPFGETEREQVRRHLAELRERPAAAAILPAALPTAPVGA